MPPSATTRNESTLLSAPITSPLRALFVDLPPTNLADMCSRATGRLEKVFLALNGEVVLSQLFYKPLTGE
jgi:hypothetical protein